MIQMSAKGLADDTDRAVAARIRQRRLAMGFSQTDLANLIGVTYQQLQKYETGANRVAAGRLVAIAKALLTTVPEFLPATGEETVTPAVTFDAQTYRVASAFQRIDRPEVRLAISDLIESCGRPDGS